MVQPTALNIVIIGLSVVIFAFLWRMAASALATRNPDSGLAKAMIVAL
jgi:hypothetical protein